MFRRVLPCAWALLLGATLACSTTVDIQVIDYASGLTLEPKQPGCDLSFYSATQAVPEACVPVGDVFVGDDKSSSKCKLERMEGEVREQACLFGADAVHIVGHQKPSFFGSTCHQLRAQFFRCGDPTGRSS